MANILTEFTPDGVVFLFNRTPNVANKYQPRGRVTFIEAAGAIAAKIATNTGTVRTSITLPRNYAYVLDQLHLTVQINELLGEVDSVENYEEFGTYLLTPGTELELFDSVKGSAAGQTTLNTKTAKTWRGENLYRLPFFNDFGAAPTLEFDLSDSDIVNATAAGNFWCNISFLMYDIEQAYDSAMNAPYPVFVRSS